MLHTGGGAGTLRYFYQGTANWFGNADAFRDGSSNPFGTAGAGDGTVSAYASYEPGASLPNTFGYTAIGGYIENDLGDSYNEGSRFRLVTSGTTLTSLHAYLDGLGGGSGTQQARMAVYYDNGAANGLAAVSNVVTIPAGQPPGWVTFNIPPTAIPPGNYWISVHTGPTAGVVRRYLDQGLGESEYNHQDTFADGTNTGFSNNDGGFRVTITGSPYTRRSARTDTRRGISPARSTAWRSRRRLLSVARSGPSRSGFK